MAQQSSAANLAAGVSIVSLFTLTSLAWAQPSANIPSYGLVGQFSLPTGAWDVGPDGRIWQIRGNNIFVQTAPNSPAFSQRGSLPAGLIASFGGGAPTASFLRISPSGSTLAIGDNNFSAAASVLFVDVASLSTAVSSTVNSVLSPNFDAAWDGNQLYVTGADSTSFNSQLGRISFASGGGTPVRSTLITDIGFASGGVAIRGGTIYTGTGFGSSAAVPTGQIRSFASNQLTGVPNVAFSSGPIVTTALSASPLGFDAAGNLLVGGGEFDPASPNRGYLAIIDPALPASSSWLTLSPGGSAINYSGIFNDATGELLVAGGGTVWRYAIPAPSAAALLALGGVLATRRHRAC